MTRSADELMGDILDAITRARVADRRMRLGESLGDDAGVQIAFQAILHNLLVIGEAVTAMPAATLERDPATSWTHFAAMRDTTGYNYHHIVPERMHRIVEEDLGALDVAVRRLRAAQ